MMRSKGIVWSGIGEFSTPSMLKPEATRAMIMASTRRAFSVADKVALVSESCGGEDGADKGVLLRAPTASGVALQELPRH
mmetsp:Transcript_124242/g.347923  ORF Transcript_124242/g.347923 Transcript_124242/m.347923 type:complete len:80 (-) Transcript_124242:1946-2185(-)